MTTCETPEHSTKLTVFDLDFYTNLIETIQDGICLLKSGQLILVNQAFCDMLGQTKNELVGKAFKQIVDPEYVKVVDLTLRSMTDAKQSAQTLEMKLLHSNQRNIWAQGKIQLLVSKQNETFHVLSLRDITTQKYLIQELELSEQHFKKIVDKLPSIYYRTDSSGILTKISPHSCEIMGYEMDQLIGHPLSKFYVDPTQREATLAKILSHKGKPIEVESLLRKNDGSDIWVTTCAYARMDNAGTFLGIEGMSIDITDRKILEKDLRDMAIKDQLTQLVNRFGLHEHLSKSLLRAKRQSSQISILFIDIDKFKNINDSLGHQAGDRFLVEFSSRLDKSFRESDLIARVGGDEFVILLDDNTLANAITNLLNRLEENMREPFTIGDTKVNFAYSFGSATYPKHGMTASDLLNYADQQMYQEKKDKRC